MELKTFIKEALKDIVEAVKESQDELDCGEIAPDVGNAYKSVELGINAVQPIQFEVSVNVVENEGSSAKLSVVAAIIGGHVEGQSNSNTGHAAKLKFNIPVRFPNDH